MTSSAQVKSDVSSKGAMKIVEDGMAEVEVKVEAPPKVQVKVEKKVKRIRRSPRFANKESNCNSSSVSGSGSSISTTIKAEGRATPEQITSSDHSVLKAETVQVQVQDTDTKRGVSSSSKKRKSNSKEKVKGKGKSKSKSNSKNKGNTGKRQKVEKAKSKSKLATTAKTRPTPMECKFATDALALLHPEVVSATDESRRNLLESCGMRDDVTDAIVSTMLSQNTTDANCKAAYKKLKQTFKTWEDVASCEDISKIEDSIKVAGLSKTRAERIQSMLRTVKEERGVASLNYIKDIAEEADIKKELSRFKGLGPKTISCVLLFALGRNDFPVDTHVLRISKSMGWVGANDTRESAYEHLNALVPNDLKMDLHCLLVRHGKCCHRCAANGRPQFPPENGTIKCPLVLINKWGGSMPSELEGKGKVIVKKEEMAIKSESDEFSALTNKRIKVEENAVGNGMKESKYFKA